MPRVETAEHQLRPRRKVVPSAVQPRGLSRVDAAGYVGVGTTLFDEWVKSRRRKIRFTIGGRVLYDRYAIDAELDDMMDSETGADDPWARMAP